MVLVHRSRNAGSGTKAFGELTLIDWTSRDDMICGGMRDLVPATQFEPHFESIDTTLQVYKLEHQVTSGGYQLLTPLVLFATYLTLSITTDEIVAAAATSPPTLVPLLVPPRTRPPAKSLLAGRARFQQVSSSQKPKAMI